MGKALRGNLLLLITAFIWGTSFVAQSVGMDYLSPFTFNTVRLFLAGMALLPVLSLARRGGRSPVRGKSASQKAMRKNVLVGGLLSGVALFAASSLQQFGVLYTTAGKAGFITSLSIVIVPILGLLLKRRVSGMVWLGVAVAVAGLYLLCIKASFSMDKGDFLVALCALFFAIHILITGHFALKTDGLVMSCIQFFVASALGVIPMLVLEAPSCSAIWACMVPLLYAGVLSGGVGYTLQIMALKTTPPTEASLLLSTESVFAVLSGALLLNEVLSPREIVGCILMLAAVILAQIPEKRTKTPRSSQKAT